MPFKNFKELEPNLDAPCLCGSTRPFANCCRDKYSKGTKFKTREYFKEKDYPKALEECRRHITWYILCHKRHTEPLMKFVPEREIKILDIDIKALHSLIEDLGRCYLFNGIINEFGSALDSFKNAIKSDRWITKLNYKKGLWYSVFKEDDKSASEQIRELDIACTDDLEALSLYYQLLGSTLGISEVLSMLAKLASHNDPAWKLKYQCLHGLTLYLHDDYSTGLHMMEEAIKEYELLDGEMRSEFGDSQLANFIGLYGRLSSNVDLVLKAVKLYDKELTKDFDSFQPEKEKATIYWHRGECLQFARLYDESISSYRISLSLYNNPLVKVFLAQSEIYSKQLDKARLTLNNIDSSKFGRSENTDLAMTWTSLASDSLLSSDIEIAKTLIKAARPEQMFFERRRLELYAMLTELTPKSSPSFVRRLTQAVNKYIELKPQVFGIGININAIISDIDDVSH